jgi:hypothetical protein
MKQPVVLLLALSASLAAADAQLVLEESAHTVFAGEPQQIRVLFHNPTELRLDVEVWARVYQASSATLMPLGDSAPWKTLTVLPAQTIVESFPLTLAAVRCRTAFQVHWREKAGQEIGRSHVVAWPRNLLAQLNTFAGAQPLFLFDPQSQLKLVLERANVKVETVLSGPDLAAGAGRLAVVVPPSAPLEPMLLSHVKKRAEKGFASVVLLQATTAVSAALAPVLIVSPGSGTIVVVRGFPVAALADSAATQRDLLRLAEWAVAADPLQLALDPNY